MNRRKASSKKRNHRMERKIFRAAEKAALRGIRPRSLRTMSYNTPASLRHDKLPIE